MTEHRRAGKAVELTPGARKYSRNAEAVRQHRYWMKLLWTMEYLKDSTYS